MTYKEIAKKYNLELNPNTSVLCDCALELMKHPKDPHHAGRHVTGVLDELDKLLAHEKGLVDKANMDVVLLSIHWHDVWLSQKSQSLNLVSFAYHSLYHGIGGAKLFAEHAKEVGLDTETTRRVMSCIKRHTNLFGHGMKWLEDWLVPVTIESKILRETDGMDGWSMRRIKDLEHYYLDKGNFDPKMVSIGKFWYKFVIQRHKPSDFYFKWSQKIFPKKKRAMLKEIEWLWTQSGKYGVKHRSL